MTVHEAINLTDDQAERLDLECSALADRLYRQYDRLADTSGNLPDGRYFEDAAQDDAIVRVYGSEAAWCAAHRVSF